MEKLTQIQINERNPVEFDDHLSFKVNKQDKTNFKKATGRLGAEYLRQAMRQITRQLTEPEQKAS